MSVRWAAEWRFSERNGGIIRVRVTKVQKKIKVYYLQIKKIVNKLKWLIICISDISQFQVSIFQIYNYISISVDDSSDRN